MGGTNLEILATLQSLYPTFTKVEKKIADFSETALANVRSKDLGEVGELLSGVVCELKKFDEEEEKESSGSLRKAAIP